MKAVALLMVALLCVIGGCGGGDDSWPSAREQEDAYQQFYGACIALANIVDQYPWLAPRIFAETDEATEFLYDGLENGLSSAGTLIDLSVYELYLYESERVVGTTPHRFPCDLESYREDR